MTRELEQGHNRCTGAMGKGPALSDWMEERALTFRLPRVRIDTSIHDVVPMLRGDMRQGVLATADDGAEVAWISAGEISTALSMSMLHQLPDVTLRSCRQHEVGGVSFDETIHQLSEHFSELGRSILPVYDGSRCIGDLTIDQLFSVIGKVAAGCCRAQRAPQRRQVQLVRPFASLRPSAVGPWLNRLVRDMMDPTQAYRAV